MEVVFYIFIFSDVIIHAKYMLLFYYLHQWFPTFSAPGIGGRQLWKTIFSTGLGAGVVVTGWVKYITLLVHFISIIITSVLPQIIKYQVPEAGDTWPTQLKKIILWCKIQKLLKNFMYFT